MAWVGEVDEHVDREVSLGLVDVAVAVALPVFQVAWGDPPREGGGVDRALGGGGGWCGGIGHGGGPGKV